MTEHTGGKIQHGEAAMSRKLKLETVSVQYSSGTEEVKAYRLGWGVCIHKSLNKSGTWTVSHEGTGYHLFDRIDTMRNAVRVANAFRRSAAAIKGKYKTVFK